MIFKPAKTFQADPRTRFLCSMRLPFGKFFILGSGPGFARNVFSRDMGDLDVIAHGEAWRRICQKGTVEKLSEGQGKERVVIKIPIGDEEGEIECRNHWFDEPITEIVGRSDLAMLADGSLLPLAPLDVVIAYKQSLNREKDQADLRELANYYGFPESYFLSKSI